MELTIANWNGHHRNGRFAKGLDYIMECLDADIICIQEMPELEKKRLQRTKGKHGYKCYFAQDFTDANGTCYLGILVKRTVKVFRKRGRKVIHKHGKSTAYLTPSTGLSESIESLSLLVMLDGKHIRVVNCHLPLYVSVTTRQHELAIVAKEHFCGAPVILAGDFNSYAHPWINGTFGRIFGCEPSERNIDEIELLEKFGRRHRLKLVFKKVITLPHWFLPHLRFLNSTRLDGSHLDHILVDESFEVQSHEVHDSLFDSDHFLIWTTVETRVQRELK